jgi:hypothetical protein
VYVAWKDAIDAVAKAFKEKQDAETAAALSELKDNNMLIAAEKQAASDEATRDKYIADLKVKYTAQTRTNIENLEAQQTELNDAIQAGLDPEVAKRKQDQITAGYQAIADAANAANKGSVDFNSFSAALEGSADKMKALHFEAAAARDELKNLLTTQPGNATDIVAAQQRLQLANQAIDAAEEQQKQQEKLASAAKQATDTIARGFADGVVNGDKLDVIVGNLIKDFAKMALEDGFKSIFGGAIGALFGVPTAAAAGESSYAATEGLDGFVTGAHASGGRPALGGPSLIGESGPELWVPDSAGTIIPNNQLGGGSGVTQHYYIDARGADEARVGQLERSLKQMNATFERRSISAWQNVRNRGGAASAALS